jgi:hypothetical protein
LNTKTTAILIGLALFALEVHGPLQNGAQKYKVTPLGLRDSENPDKSFVLIQCDKTAEASFKSALDFFQGKNAESDQLVKTQVDDEYLRIERHLESFGQLSWWFFMPAAQANYTVVLRFKNGQVKYEVVGLDIYLEKDPSITVSLNGSTTESYPIFDDSGRILRKTTKEYIEKFFEAEIAELTEAIRR